MTEAPRPSDVALVAAGGCAGSLGRTLAVRLLPHAAGTWAWSTFLVNVVGAFVLAVVLVRVTSPTARGRRVRLLVGTGLLGGFTTFSAFALDAAQLARAERLGIGLWYVVVGVVSVLLGAGAGLLLGRRWPGVVTVDPQVDP